MLKSNSKKAREHVMQYVQDACSEYYIEDCGAPADLTDADLCRLIIQDFEEQWSHELKHNACRVRPLSRQELFMEWGRGLTAGGLFAFFYHCTAVQVLGDILEETEAERSKYTEAQAENYLCYLICREVTKKATEQK